MADSNSTLPTKTKVREFGNEFTYLEVTKELHWIVIPDNAPKCPDDLSFTSRHEVGRINWWDVTPTETDYWEVHRQHGRALAFELLDLIHNPEHELNENGEPSNWFGYIASEIARTAGFYHEKYNTDGLYMGFFEAIGEHLITGHYNR